MWIVLKQTKGDQAHPLLKKRLAVPKFGKLAATIHALEKKRPRAGLGEKRS